MLHLDGVGIENVETQLLKGDPMLLQCKYSPVAQDAASDLWCRSPGCAAGSADTL